VSEQAENNRSSDRRGSPSRAGLDGSRLGESLGAPTGVAVVGVIVTARDEAATLKETLEGLGRAFPGAPLWLADDASTDATAAIGLAAGARVLSCPRHVGKGAAATVAARAALRLAAQDRGRCAIVLCDGDLGACAAELAGLLSPIARGQADIAVAAFSARIGGGFGIALGYARSVVRRRAGMSLQAPLSGQRAIRVEVLEDLLPFASGFGMELGIALDAARAGHRVAEVELDLTHRVTGRDIGGFLHRGRQLIDLMRVGRR